jgi:hypothetical protein
MVVLAEEQGGIIYPTWSFGYFEDGTRNFDFTGNYLLNVDDIIAA